MKLVVILFLCISVAFISQTSATEHHSSKSGETAGGKDEKGAKASEFKQIKKITKSSKHDVEKAKKGEIFKEIHKKDNAESGGKKTKHHSKNGHKSSKLHSGSAEHGAKFQEGAKKKKLNYKKGYREKYHKDEEKKHNSFYSNSQKSGDFEVFGQKHAKFNSLYSAKKHVENHKGAKAKSNYKKGNVNVGGHKIAEKKGHKEEKGSKSHHNHQEQWAKKSGKKGGTHYKYKVPTHK